MKKEILSRVKSVTRKKIVQVSTLLFLSAASLQLEAKTGVLMGQQAPEFSLKTLDGSSLVLDHTVIGKPIYLKFWATWCSYCTEEMPHLQQVYDNYGDEITVVAVNVGMNDSVTRVKQFMQKRHLSLPVSFDAVGDMVEKFHILGTPQHILIDKEGKIIHRSALLSDDLQQKIFDVIEG